MPISIAGVDLLAEERIGGVIQASWSEESHKSCAAPGRTASSAVANVDNFLIFLISSHEN